MRNHFRIGVLVVGVVATCVSRAATYSCMGTIDFVAVAPTGVVTVSSQSSGLATFYPCQLGATVNGVTSDTCKGILTVLLEAKATGAQVGWWFNDSIGCNRSSYNGGNWYWLSESPGGWYYGPQIQ
jgi:hypothetical protein